MNRSSAKLRKRYSSAHYKPGTFVEIADTMGLDSGKAGFIVSNREFAHKLDPYSRGLLTRYRGYRGWVIVHVTQGRNGQSMKSVDMYYTALPIVGLR